MVIINNIESTSVDTEMRWAKITDVASGTATYYGWAQPGSAVTATAWRIARLETTGSASHLKWSRSLGGAGGTATYIYGAFDKIWNNRVTYTYD